MVCPITYYSQAVNSYSPGGTNVPSHVDTLALAPPANMIELVVPSAYSSPQSKQQIDRLCHSCTAHGRKSLYLQWALLSPIIAPSDVDIWTPI